VRRRGGCGTVAAVHLACDSSCVCPSQLEYTDWGRRERFIADNLGMMFRQCKPSETEWKSSFLRDTEERSKTYARHSVTKPMDLTPEKGKEKDNEEDKVIRLVQAELLTYFRTGNW
jgi:hypothetical protein